VQDFCVYSGVFGDRPSNAANQIFPRATLVAWQQNLGHNGLELGLRKRYVEDLCIRWGVFQIGLFWYGQSTIIQKCTYAPAKIKR